MRLSVAQQIERIRATPGSGRIVAFFDLDRTLIDGYSLTALAWQQIFNGEMSVRRGLSLGAMFLSYGLGRKRYEDMLRATVDDITGMHEDELRRLARQAYDARLVRWIYREGCDLVKAHHEVGHDVVLVTSATHYQAEPVASALAIEHMCCTELEIVDGRVAGGVVPCYGTGKLDAARQFAATVEADLADAFFYSDSHEDLPLLEGVGRPVVVNGKSKLTRLSGVRGWPMLEFAQKGFVHASRAA